MRAPNRKDLRAAIAASMTTALVGPSKVAQHVYAYQVGEFDHILSDNTPADVSIFVLASDGTDPQADDSRFIGGESILYLNVHIFVLYEKENEWTEAQSEDQIDDMSANFIDWCSDNADRRSESVLPPWLEMSIMGRSDISSIFVMGKEYRHEAFSLAFSVANTE